MNARLVVVETLYHQLTDEQPTAVEHKFSRPLSSDEQPYQRKLKAGQDWQPLDLGWIPLAGQIHVRNDEGKFAKVPTKEEKEEAAGKVLLLAFSPAPGQQPKRTMHSPPAEIVPDIPVPPGESCRFMPAPGRTLLVKAMNGTVAFTLFATPY